MSILSGQIIATPSTVIDHGVAEARLCNAGGDGAAANGISLPGSGDR